METITSSTYNVRILPVNEWHRLNPEHMNYASYDEHFTNIMVIERDDEIIAHWALLPIYHAEGIWVKEEYRKNPSIIKKLLLGMKKMAESVDAPFVVTTTQDDKVKALLDKLPNTEILHGDFYAMSFED